MSKANILIVEDEAIIAKEIKANLENMGYAVTSIVKSGKDAVGPMLMRKSLIVPN
jgi:CheY-like chemotaxis protein